MEEIRAVVHLNDIKCPGKPASHPGEAFIGAAASGQSTEAFQHGGQISVLDRHSLSLVRCHNPSNPHLLLTQKLHFDVLCTRESESGDEIAGLLSNLFERRRDGFLMHLKVKRECHLMLLLDTLAIQVRSKLQREGLHLDHGLVRFAKLLEEDHGRSGSWNGNGLQAQSSFKDLHGLMLWLLTQYRMRAERSTGPGHEALEVEYAVSSEERRLQFSVRLHVLLVASEELSAMSMQGLRRNFGDQQVTSAVQVTELTSFVMRVFKRSRGQVLYMPVLFHVVSTNSQVDARNAQLLSLAHLISQHSSHRPDSVSSISSFGSLNNLEVHHQEIRDRFRLLHASLVQYIQKAEQLKSFSQRLDDQLAQFEELLKQSAGSEFGHILQASQANLHYMNNLMGKHT
ncbi:uncharacterized protein LOC108086834 [Drosophila ficusphila]|uniref:uncharacterized protein LOC108086834 n=1 Tax=Drosophila ficusphila TaxID=30025 RepID=UPI0007E6729B|nr:uncharacterized protein LOC108086834 [Drosophila ficusphila]